ncbi:MAG: porin family protein [Petrimonas sp.]|uniref:porin family protein n=2 Tax=Petrimonas sp. TaxID=2023866 RepID=UPI002B3C232F|nr:porin family protein [Petrimonas sp.]MEA5044925.1 porin family protein [Petrimonas sp.]
MNIKLILIACISAISLFTLKAQETVNKKIEWSMGVGFNIGATAPLSVPQEVRSIDLYSPNVNPNLRLNAIYNFDEKWGAGIGLQYETKGMRVKSQVKHMYINFVPVGGDPKTDNLEGYFVGKNSSEISNSYLTIPIYATYRISNKWRLKGGCYFSNTLKSKFTGSVSDGYLRIYSPVGDKQIIDFEEFDFSEDVRDYDIGFILDAEYKLTNRISITGGLSWGMMPIFYSERSPMQFKMRNYYGAFGISYLLGFFN